MSLSVLLEPRSKEILHISAHYLVILVKYIYSIQFNSVPLVQVFGKTMENVRKRVDVKLLRSDEEEKILKLGAKPTFTQQEIFNEDLVGIQNRKEKVALHKPIYAGMSVLDLSKHLMYDYYYNTLKKAYGNLVKMCYTDTDSVIIQVTTTDITTDMLQNLDEYDTSNYPSDHPLYSTANKKVIGKFKDEFGGRLMTEFVGIRAKMYSYTGEESGKRAKGVKRSVLRKTISHDYRTCLLEKKSVRTRHARLKIIQTHHPWGDCT